MHFEYDDKPANDDVLAYIDNEGDLIVRDSNSNNAFLFSILTDGGHNFHATNLWEPEQEGILKSFRRGDKVTIEF